MLFSYDYMQTMAFVLSYTIIYNATSFLLFATIMQVVSTDIKTLYSLANLGASNIYAKILGLCVLSLAGVPPLVGFFAKIFTFVLLSASNLFLLFPPFFVLLFVGLYFYVQNLRFLNSTNLPSSPSIVELNPRPNLTYFTCAIPLSFLIVFGFCYVDDLLLLASWLLL
jgi:NADH:ubiquinone oxidoreductase subunit 2 (subunit N)